MCGSNIPDTADWRTRGITKCTGGMHPPRCSCAEARPPMPLNKDVCAFDFRFVTEFASEHRRTPPSTTHYRDSSFDTTPASSDITENALLRIVARSCRNEYPRRSCNRQRGSTLFIRRVCRLHADLAPDRYISSFHLKNNYLITIVAGKIPPFIVHLSSF